MKTISKKNIFVTLLILMVVSIGVMFQSCDEYPNEYEISGGVPSVNYIRVTNPESSDSLVVRAFLNNTIALIGENLRSITELWFNDKQAYLNTSFITSNSLIVTVPNEIPSDVTNKIYMIAGKDTVTYDFIVDVPAPKVSGMLCEYVPDGDIAVIYGNYFIDNPNIPLSVIFPGNIPATEIVSVDINEVQVKVPAGAGVGPIAVKSLYGTGMSSFYFRDNRNIILDWDVLDASGGWRAGVIGNSSPEGISGNYVRFNGSMTADASATWNEDSFSFNLWNSANGRSNEPFYTDDLSIAALKFECYVVEPWSSGALQMIFTPYSVSGTNSYIADVNVPRALWLPWTETGSYKTEGWTTVTVPLSEFIYTHEGKSSTVLLTNDMLGGLTFFVWAGGVEGADCTVHMCIDNIRVVPM